VGGGWVVCRQVEFRKCHNYSTCCLLRDGRGRGCGAGGNEGQGGHISGTFRLVGWPNNTGMTSGQRGLGNFIMYFRLLSFTWQRNIKIFDICINNTGNGADLGQVERQIWLVLSPHPQTTHISCLELGKFKKPAHASAEEPGDGMEGSMQRRQRKQNRGISAHQRPDSWLRTPADG